MEMRDRGLTGLGEIQAILEHYQMDLQNEVRRVLQDPICVEEAIACAEERIYSAASWICKLRQSNLKALILIIARNAAKSLQKSKDCMFNPLGEDQDLILHDLEQRSFPYLPKLRSNYQDVIVLKYYFELPNPVIGTLLGISEKNICIRIYRAKKRIQELIEQERPNFKGTSLSRALYIKCEAHGA